MGNKIVLLRSGNCIVKVLGQFRNKLLAKDFIAMEHTDFYEDHCQYSKFGSPYFITIE